MSTLTYRMLQMQNITTKTN